MSMRLISNICVSAALLPSCYGKRPVPTKTSLLCCPKCRHGHEDKNHSWTQTQACSRLRHMRECMAIREDQEMTASRKT